MALPKAAVRRLSWSIRPPVLALGGGGARGFAHLGVLEVLDQAKIPVRAVVGTSMGAVVGAMYLAYGSAEAAIARWREGIASDRVPPIRSMRPLPEAGTKEHPLVQAARRIRSQFVVAFAINRTTVLDDGDMTRAFEFLVPDVAVPDLARPFMAVATDFVTGAEVRLKSGRLREVLRASSSIPGLVPAVAIDGRPLVDGGVVAEVPVAAGLELGWPVVAVDVSMELPPISQDDLVLDTMVRAQMITASLLRRSHLTKARAVIRPAVGMTTWADWNRFEDLVEAGRAAARSFLGLPQG